MTLEDRMNKARVEGYETRRQFQQMRRERAEVRQASREELFEWRLAGMRQSILIAELKKNLLLTGMPRPDRGAQSEHGQLPSLRIQ